ncbi:alginate export family protein [Gallaecimonas pentaromativorans]|uniref:alginate export family protein n=1 Tax=Gallaecimonas pentaromativorans TaxID=584787 RepID=UPI003A94DA9B
MTYRHRSWLLLAPLLAMAASTANAATGRPAILSNRWQEDWSALADPALKTQPLDSLKYLSLGDDPANYLSFGANLRERYETNHSPRFGTVAGQGDGYLINRMEVHADLRLGEVQTFVQLQNDSAPGKKNKGPADANKLDLEQAFVALVHPIGNDTLKIRAGRQQFAFDLQRFVSVREGPNVRRSFDALWSDYETGQWRFIGYYSQPVVNKDRHSFDDTSSHRQRFYGARVERLILGGNELSAYWSRFADADAHFLTVSGNEQRDVWDLRFAGKKANFDWDLEAMLQTGDIGGQRIRAWGSGSRVGYTFKDAALAPRLAMQLDAASGDTNPNDNKLGTFNPLFPNGSYLNLAGYTGYVNFIHVKPSVTIKPMANLSLMGAVAGLWRMTTDDAVYTMPSIAVPNTAGHGSRYTGAYGQLRLDWKVSGHLSTAIEAVHYEVGSSLKAAGGSDSDYLGVELKFGW